ncbi:hypothetical protein DID88_008069 [Monilinia fructigena]|uniref:Postreplication repair E3 ubiquitin-protein ligase RAD18 n=1 Tax=Monilinia fructigena TaxID=38457 RepID=A0A395J4U8_9HELO|nr:hypothetical protein DID88_008069 [Monilinia fructigena]
MPRKRNIQKDENVEAIDWSECLVNQLKAELERRGLSKTGRKADLVARLQASDDGTLIIEPKDKVKRIRKERMFMLNRQKTVDAKGRPREDFDIAGSTGNIYQTKIGRVPTCTCMDARIRGQKCKHINFWCKAACGQNFHRECFEQWKASKRGGVVTCVYCRTPWQDDDAPPRPAPGGLASLKDTAPKVGSYQNIWSYGYVFSSQEGRLGRK